MHGGAQGAVDALNTLYLLSVATAASMRESCVESTSVYLIQPFFSVPLRTSSLQNTSVPHHVFGSEESFWSRWTK